MFPLRNAEKFKTSLFRLSKAKTPNNKQRSGRVPSSSGRVVLMSVKCEDECVLSDTVELMTMRTGWKSDDPAENRLARSCPGHKSKGRRTKTLHPLETHQRPPLPTAVATGYHHLPSITAQQTMLRLVGWWTGSPWQHKDPLMTQCRTRTRSGLLRVETLTVWTRISRWWRDQLDQKGTIRRRHDDVVQRLERYKNEQLWLLTKTSHLTRHISSLTLVFFHL